MAERVTTNGVTAWTIASADASATFIPAWGGVGSSIVFSGRELLYQHDWFWEADTPRIRGGWPFLFPTCGRLTRDGRDGSYLYNGQRYQLPNHGFAPRAPWRAEDVSASILRLHLADSEVTRAVYPFAFQLSLEYEIQPNRLIVRQRYHNPGDTILPFYAGFHPYFLTPAPGGGKEQATIDHQPFARWNYNPSLTDITGPGELPPFPMSVTDPRLQELLTEVPADNTMALRIDETCTLHLRLFCHERPDLFRFVQHYTLPDEPFFCYEPWMSHPNALNTVGAPVLLEPNNTLVAELQLWTADA